MTPSGIKPATFRLVVLNQLRHRVPLQDVESSNAKKVQNTKREKLEEALIKKMQINANKNTTTDGVIEEGAQMVYQFCTQPMGCIFL